MVVLSGVERTQHSYNIRGIATGILLIVSDTRSVRISMLSDEEFSEVLYMLSKWENFFFRFLINDEANFYMAYAF